MGKRKTKKNLSRRARQAIRDELKIKQERERKARNLYEWRRERTRIRSDKALHRKDNFKFDTILKDAGWINVNRDKSVRFRSLAKEVWTKRPGLLTPPYLEGVSNLALISHTGTHAEWDPAGRGLTSAFRSLVTHVLGRYPAEANLVDSMLAKHESWQGAEVTARIVKAVISGRKVSGLAGTKELPPPLTRRMCHLMVNPDRPQTIVASARRAQVLAYGGKVVLARSLGNELLGGFKKIREEIFWDEVIHWLCRQPDLDPVQAAPLCDFLRIKYRENQDFHLKGRTLATVTRDMNLWHKQLNDLSRFKSLKDFTMSGFATCVWKKTQVVSGREVPGDVWTLAEIRNPKQLVTEGVAMGHCVAGYHSAIASGKSSIWSLTLNSSRRLTIEVHNRSKNVVQVRGKYNRDPDSRESAFIRGWAKKNGFAIGEYCL